MYLAIFAALMCTTCTLEGDIEMIYTVTFNINRGIGTTPSAIKAKYGTNIKLPNDNGFSRIGYTFNGWETNSYSKANANNNIYYLHLEANDYLPQSGVGYISQTYYTVIGNVTLYAKWE